MTGYDVLWNAPDPDTCTSCGDHKPGEMGAHAGHTHWCRDCLAEGSS